MPISAYQYREKPRGRLAISEVSYLQGTRRGETEGSDAWEPYFSGCILCSLDFWRPLVFVLKTEKVPDTLRANWSKLKFKPPSSKLKTVERRKEWVTFESLGQGRGGRTVRKHWHHFRTMELSQTRLSALTQGSDILAEEERYCGRRGVKKWIPSGG